MKGANEMNRRTFLLTALAMSVAATCPAVAADDTITVYLSPS